MSIWDSLDNIKPNKLSSEMPDEFKAKIVEISRDTKKTGTGAGSPVIKIVLDASGEEVVSTYRIPKALTGKGQYDTLMKGFNACGYAKIGNDLIGKEFIWKKEELTGAVRGNARHYPIKEVPQKLVKGK